MTRKEADVVIENVCDYFHINLNKLSMEESIKLYNTVYHSVGIL